MHRPVERLLDTGTGLGLVEMLTRQLNGKLTLEGAQGVTVQVIFEQK